VLLRELPTAEIEIAHSQPQPAAHRHHNRHNPGASRRGAPCGARVMRYYIWRNNRRRHREIKMGDISRLSVKCTRSSHESEILERDPRSISPLAMPLRTALPLARPPHPHPHTNTKAVHAAPYRAAPSESESERGDAAMLNKRGHIKTRASVSTGREVLETISRVRDWSQCPILPATRCICCCICVGRISDAPGRRRRRKPRREPFLARPRPTCPPAHPPRISQRDHRPPRGPSARRSSVAAAEAAAAAPPPPA
jgi:hypothetical protein